MRQMDQFLKSRAAHPATTVRKSIEPVDGYEIPATFVFGGQPGPTILISAGIHSGEYPGIPASVQAVKELDPAQLRGTILFLHCVNTSGFRAHTDSVLPEDGENLNRGYPGSETGTVGQQIKNWFVTEVFPHLDFMMDLHSGSVTEPLTPCLFFPKSEGVREISLAAAKALDIPYLIASEESRGQYSYAAHHLGIPGILCERGWGGACHKEWVSAYVRDIFLLLAHLEMYDAGVERQVCDKHIFIHTEYLTASATGLWYPAITAGQQVKQGQLLGKLETFWGEPLTSYYAQGDGIVFYHSCALSANQGDPLVAYGIL